MPFPIGTSEGQAALFYARKRRRSIFGPPSLDPTLTFLATAALPAGAFVDRTAPITIHVGLDVTAGATGLIFEFGSAASGIAAWVSATGLGFRAGGTGGAAALVTSSIAATGSLSAVLVADPAADTVAMWINGEEVGRAVAASGFAEWAADSAGTILSAGAGVPADVAESGAPAGFHLTAPVSFYERQTPQFYS